MRSAAITALFANHARAYQVLSRQANAFHAQFVEALSAASASYATAEAADRRKPWFKTFWVLSMHRPTHYWGAR